VLAAGCYLGEVIDRSVSLFGGLPSFVQSPKSAWIDTVSRGLEDAWLKFFDRRLDDGCDRAGAGGNMSSWERLGLSVLGLGSALTGRAVSGKLSPSPVFPPETSLLRMKGFVPAGFLSGIEIMNDNLTPMEFVVSGLQNCVGLKETDAIRTMLEIHRKGKGGILLPMRSFEESRRVAELVTAEAHSKNHPSVCRAVRVE
jgi:ATP-dependent Clp protease adapter protein ClpS